MACKAYADLTYAVMKSLLLILGFCICYSFAEETTTATKAGVFVGFMDSIDRYKNLEVVKYLGIPYAEPPTGEKRFNKPATKAKLEEPYDATFFRPACTTVAFKGKDDFLGFLPETSEDCLYLNIYVPKMDQDVADSEKYAVMIWIHGGIFRLGSADPYAADTLSAFGRVIVVTLNYRLSIFGFGSTEDKHLPGNYGLWDQQMAIKWVHDNIADFGGDPERVTIFGESAGGASAVYQALYPGNKGLIHRVIAESGSPLCPWAFNKKPKSSIEWIAKAVGCSEDNTRDMINCMRFVSLETIHEALIKMMEAGVLIFQTQFAPVVDNDFVLDIPEEIFNGRSGSLASLEHFQSVDFLGGINNAEGFLFISPAKGIPDPENFKISRVAFEDYVERITKTYAQSEVPDIMKEFLSAEYTNWSDPDNSTLLRQGYVQMLSDIIFITPEILTTNTHARQNGKSRTFLYHFDVNPSTNIFPIPSWGAGANHADEILYIFGFEKNMLKQFPSFQNRKYEIQPWETELSETMMSMWSNFAKTGNPNTPNNIGVHWPEYDGVGESGQYLNIKEQRSTSGARRGLYGRNVHFWSKLVPTLRKLRHSEYKMEINQNSCSKDGSCPP